MTTSITVTTNFDTAANFTFDANLIEIFGAVARLRQNPNLTFAASYRTTGQLDADFALGSVTATPTGADTLAWNGADFRTTAIGTRIDYLSASTGTLVNQGTIRLVFVPDYTGVPVTASEFIQTSASTFGALPNQISIVHFSGTGNVRVQMRDSAGALIVDNVFGQFTTAVRNTPVELEYNWDLTAGANRVFIDGVQLGVTDSTTGTRSAGSSFVGITGNLITTQEFALFDAVKHTGGYTPGVIDPNDPDIIFGARYRDFSLDADIGSGTTATAVGTVRIVHGADLEGGVPKGAHHIDYSATSNVDNIVQQGAFRFTVIPNYAGAPVVNQIFLNISKSASQADNSIFVFHSLVSGNIDLVIRDKFAALIFNGTIGQFSAVAGQPSQHEFNFNIDTGDLRYFIDGVLIGSAAGATGVRQGNQIGAFRIGDALSGPGSGADFFIRDFGAFSTVQHVADYDASEAGLLISSGDPTIKLNSTFDADALLSFLAVVTVTLPDEVRFTMEVNGIEMWFDGASWATSNGTLAETNTAAEIDTNASALDLSAGVRIRPVVYLHSQDGFTTPGPTITSHTFGHDFFSFGGDQPEVRECVVFGFEIDNEGNPEVGITVRVINEAFAHSAHFVQPSEASTTTDSNGRWELQVVETASVDANLRPYRFVVGQVSHEDIAIPDQVSVVFNDLLP